MSSEKQTVLVTGASRGIGAAIAQRLAGDDRVVIGTATSQAGADAISENFQAQGLFGVGRVLNVTDPESIAALLDSLKQEFAAPTVLVNNAGITRDNLLLRMKQDEWDDIIDTNLSSVYRMSKACLRGMTKARFGRIVNIGSVVGLMGNAGQTNYSAAKAGMIGFTRSLAREVGTRNITVNAVAPGFIKTDMTRALSDDQQAQMMASIPLGRFGSVDDIADGVAFLCSAGAGYITGNILNINGGMYMA